MEEGGQSESEGKEESYRQEQVLKEVQAAARLCTAVYQCNLPLLRRLMRAGTPVNAGDYDKRTALHISAAEGNLPVVCFRAS
jgi:glutaminase